MLIMKKTAGFHPGILLNKVSKFTVFMFIVILIVLSGFRKDTRKPFRNYVVLVSLDAFRWDYCKLYNTPNLNKLAKDGLHLKRIINSKN
jgi:predicted AlkP superfamily pyrophosphatase or phosphodiesterase